MDSVSRTTRPVGRTSLGWWKASALALGASGAAFGLRLALADYVGPPYVLFFPAVLLATLAGGLRTGVLATLLSGALAARWILPLERGGGPMTLREGVSLAVFVASGLLVASVAHRYQRARARAEAAERAAALREASARLADSEERLRRTRHDAHMSAAQLAAVIHAVQDGISLADRSGRFILVNPALAQMHGFPTTEDGWADLESAFRDLELSELDGGAVPRDRWPTARALRGEAFDAWLLRARRRDTGREYVLSYSGQPIRRDGGEIEFALLVTRDVTRERQAQEALQRSEQRFRALIEKSSDMIQVLGADGRVTFWSPATGEVMGWREEEMLGRPALEWIHPEDRERVAALLERLIARPGGRESAPLRYRHVDGSWRHLEVTARNLLDDAAVQGVVVNSRDVSEQRALEQQLRQAQKLESVGRLAGGVAHDFNNLLTVILAGVDALRSGLVGGDPSAEVVEEIGAAGERARDLTQRLLAFARKQVFTPESLDLSAVVHGAERLLRRVLGEDVLLDARLAPDLWPVRCDRGQLEQVIVNLAVNARDAMPRGGRLTLETSNVELSAAQAGARAGLRPGRWARLAVQDDGEGMPPEVRERLFEPFFTTKAKGKGTGLGLSTVYGIVAQSDGHILVDSEPGRGTTFEIFLPAVTSQAAEVAPPPAPATHQGTERVLVVEDDAQVRTVTVRVLSGAGYQVLVASGGQEALALAAGDPAPIAILVTDVVMPGMSGRAVAEQLVAARPGLRVLFVSGYTQEMLDGRGEVQAGVELLPKPFTPAALLARVRAVLDR